VAGSTAFLYSGPDPVQESVAPGAIKAVRGAVIRGRVLDRAGQPLSGVRIDVLDHPEFGRTLSREDGRFDLAVNGGGALTVSYSRDGYLSSQRQVEVPWQDFAAVEDVRMVAVDAAVTRIEPSAQTEVARSSPVSDADGERRVTMMFEPGTHATMRLADGSQRPLSSMGVRATEFTVGSGGPEAMPGELPSTSAYTYAAELSVDEARAAGATRVDFDKPIAVYVDNFLDMPVGTHVPLGYYDRARGTWVAAQDGRVIKLLDAGPTPTVDADGDGQPESQDQLDRLGLDGAELGRLAGLYAAGATLWRVQVDHFTPWDCNWPYGPPADARPPKLNPDKKEKLRPDEPCKEGGCVITPEDQTLGEQIDVAGTPLTLNYRSDRAPGRTDANTLQIPLSDGTIPASLRRIELEVEVAGKTITRSFPAQPDLSTTFAWDGKDAYGRTVNGARAATVRVDYVYPAVYGTSTAAFGQSFGAFGDVALTGNAARQEVTFSQQWTRPVGTLTADDHAGLHGWTLSAHHAYDPADRTLLFGDGDRRSEGGAVNAGIMTVAGNGQSDFGGDGGPATAAQLFYPGGIAVGPDGSLYIADVNNERVRRVGPDGTITTIAGNGSPGFSGDGGPATAAQLYKPRAVAVGPDGSLYIADGFNYRVRRVGPAGTITTIAGNGSPGFSGDGGPATAAQLASPAAVTVGSDGSLYIADAENGRVRRVGPDGTITTVAGNGSPGFSGDGGPATAARLTAPTAVTVGSDGSLYVTDNGESRVRRVGPDGTITTVAGNGQLGFSGDGGPATAAKFDSVGGVAVGPDGSLYIADLLNRRVRRVGPDGTITTVAGNGQSGFSGDGGLATAAKLYDPRGVAVGPDGSLYIAGLRDGRVRRVAPVWPGFSAGDIVVASSDGSQLYEFNEDGRHLRTVDALTGAVLLRCGYDPEGRLASVEDVDGNVTRVQRDPQGGPTAIVAPGGQRTELAVDEHGMLSRVTQPGGATFRLGYRAGGLLESFERPGGGVSRFAYDDQGLLVRSEGPQGDVQTFERSQDGAVTRTDELGRKTTYSVERLGSGSVKRTVTEPGGATQIALSRPDGTNELTAADGTRVTTSLGPDPRFGMLAPITTQTTRTPGGRESTYRIERAAVLADPSDPLSLKTLTERVVSTSGTSTTTFDTAARTLTMVSAEGRRSVSTFDDRGRLVRAELDGVAPLLVSYDGRGRRTRLEQAGSTRTFSYDDANRLTRQTDALGRETSYTYDAAERVSTVSTPGGRTYHFDYDADGNRREVRLADGATHMLAHDSLDRLTGYTPPAGAQATRRYLADGALDETAVDGARAARYSYQASGRPLAIQSPEATLEFEYEDGDPTTRPHRLVRRPTADRPSQALGYGYDGGLLTSSTASGPASATYAYTYAGADAALSRIDVSSGADSFSTNLAFDADGLLTHAGPFDFTRAGPAGSTSKISDGTDEIAIGFNSRGKIDTRTQRVSGHAVFGEALEHDPAGRVARRSETVGATTRSFEYDYAPDGELREVRRDGQPVERYQYDDHGNRTSAQYPPAAAETTTFNARDQVTARGPTRYEYDLEGFLSRRGADTFEYATSGELLAADIDGSHITYDYDALSRRVAQSDSTGTTQYLYGDPASPFLLTAVRASDGTLSRLRYDDSARLIAIERGGQRYYVATDGLGTPRAVSDAQGNVIKTIEQDSFGRTLSDSNPAFELPIGFAGGLQDAATGLVRFGLRDYEPLTGRWTARDLILFAAGQVNLYSYANNDPVNARDPTGLAAGTSAATKSRANVCIGASSYEGLGGGAKICLGAGGVAVCGEIGIGAGTEMSIGIGALPSNQVYIQTKVQAGPVGIDTKLSLEGDGRSSLEVGLANKSERSSLFKDHGANATFSRSPCGLDISGGGVDIGGPKDRGGYDGGFKGTNEELTLKRETPVFKGVIGGCIGTGSS
jgi:RHS repeat-associated protein